MGKMFVVIFFWELIFADCWKNHKNRKNYNPAIKILCYTVVFALEGLFCDLFC